MYNYKRRQTHLCTLCWVVYEQSYKNHGKMKAIKFRILPTVLLLQLYTSSINIRIIIFLTHKCQSNNNSNNNDNNVRSEFS